MRHPTLETYFFHYQTKKRERKKAKSMVFFAFGRAVGGFQRDEKYGRASAEGFMVGDFRLGGGEIENNISTPRGMKSDKIGQDKSS
ncbi:hypothetical protein TNIN_195461 [Trichonephila inaurata madagascariensis]|uniref:Uncharacterized protein n=1 Tax=Trichonephila inaurata madagascariensis TaxID=2747483 RepID=A0A8X6KIP4_9ARAC|nr:hypothetical protein TNIN_195461 [Trichonephila inaurata madagascariensis]